MLLAAHFKTGELDEVAFEVEVEILHVRIDIEGWVIFFAFDLRRRLQQLFRDLLSDDPSLGEHQNMRLINVKDGVVGAL